MPFATSERSIRWGMERDIVPVVEPAPGVESHPFDIVGPVCESGDTFAKQRLMPPVKAGDLVAFRSAGAYGAVQACTYNSRLLVPEVLVNGERYALIRPRQSYDELIGLDRLAAWQQ